MSEADPPIHENDLHAYADGLIGSDRRPVVERHLAENPEAAQRVADYQMLRTAARRAFMARDTEPLPPELSLAHIIAERGHRRMREWLIAASVVLALGVGVAGGWFLHGQSFQGPSQRALALLEQEALSSHVVYAADKRHPVEVPGTEAPHLRQWLSNRLDRSVELPDLSALGYRLIGGRLLATERAGAAALLMYENDDHHRLTVLLRPMTPTLHAPGTPIGEDGVNGRAWIGNGLGVAVLSAAPDSEVSQVAARIKEEFGKPG